MTRISRNRHARIKVSIFRHRGVNYSIALDVPGATACKLGGMFTITILSTPVRTWRQLRALYRTILAL